MARFQQLSNDMYWEVFCPVCFKKPGERITFTPLKWIGYNDARWWETVAPRQKKRECPSCKSIIEIDFETNEITVLEAKS
jgi:hypothetical protein